MVLSLAFVLAFIGAAVGLLIGILIFGEVSDAISCPSSSGGGSEIITTYLDTFSQWSSQVSLGSRINLGQLMTFATPQSIHSIAFFIEDSEITSSTVGSLQGVIYSGVSAGSPSFTQIGTSVETFSAPWNDNGDGGTLVPFAVSDPFSNHMKFTFNPPITVSGSGFYLGLTQLVILGDLLEIGATNFDIGGNEGEALRRNSDISNFQTFSRPDIVMKIETIELGGGGGETETGSEQCESAKETAWTVIGIMPVALFFGLFALFSSFQRPT